MKVLRVLCVIGLFGFVPILTQPVWAQPQASGPAMLPWCARDGVSEPVMQTKLALEDLYPPLSVALNEEGATVVNFTVKQNGTVADVEVASSSGFLRLDDASVAAMRQMIYSQPKRGDAPIDCRTHLKIVWKLRGEPELQNMPLVLTAPQSLYPTAARAQRREGMTYVSIITGMDGHVVSMKVLRSSGSDDLDDASIAYIKTLHVQGAQIDGRPTLSNAGIGIVWSLDPKGATPTARGKP